jgi:hypothetical protein
MPVFAGSFAGDVIIPGILTTKLLPCKEDQSSRRKIAMSFIATLDNKLLKYFEIHKATL